MWDMDEEVTTDVCGDCKIVNIYIPTKTGTGKVYAVENDDGDVFLVHENDIEEREEQTLE
jgi:hypothetical protein